LLPDIARGVGPVHVLLGLALEVGDRHVVGVLATDVDHRGQLWHEAGVPRVAVLGTMVTPLAAGRLAVVLAGARVAQLPGTGLGGGPPPAGQLVLGQTVVDHRGHRPGGVVDLLAGQPDRLGHQHPGGTGLVDDRAAVHHVVDEVRGVVHPAGGEGGDTGRV